MERPSLIIDHADIVTTHVCNKKCLNCIDKFLGSSTEEVSLQSVHKFLELLRKHTDKAVDVLLLGGEPTILSEMKLIQIADMIHKHGFLATMSTNGILRQKIISLIPYFDFIQITVNKDKDIDLYREWNDRINIKWVGDSSFTLAKLNHFAEYTQDFSRKSVSMYFTPDFQELCTDKEIWELFDTLDWQRNGSYTYTFYKGVRIKKCIHGATNIIDEDTVPKLYPNGNYNRTWINESLDAYLGEL